MWGDDIVIMENPVDLGTNVPQLVVPQEELRSLETNRAPAAAIRPNPAAAAPPTTSTNASRRSFYDWRRQGRPYWMKEDQYKELIEKKGAHTFVIVMSGELARRATLERSLDADDHRVPRDHCRGGLRPGLAQPGKDF